MIYDGTCGFCVRWIQRWRRQTRGCVDYIAAQETLVRERFPEIRIEQLDEAVHLIEPGGSVLSGAEAVLASLAVAGRHVWLLKCYRRSGTFARIAEWCYRFVARHRKFFSSFG